jgi:hypothetical protein
LEEERMRPILKWAGGLIAFVMVGVASASQSGGSSQGVPQRVTLLEGRLAALEVAIAELPANQQAGFEIVDANGVVLGEVADTTTPNSTMPGGATVVLTRGNALFAVGVRQSTFHGSSALFFSTANCTLSASGGPWVIDNGGVFPSVAIAPPGNTVYLQDSSAPASVVTSLSFIRGGETDCTESTNTFLSYQAVPIANLSAEFTAPYRVRIRH